MSAADPPPDASPAPGPRPRTVLLFPGIFGVEKTFDDLCDALRERYDVRVAPYPALSAPTRLLMDIDAMAASVASRLMAEPSDGPSLIVGYSYGANLAYAVAERLLAAGGRVALLGLLDPALPTTQFDVYQRGPASDVTGVPLPRPGLVYRSRLLRSALAGLFGFASARTRQRFRRRTLWSLRAYARRAWTPHPVGCPVLHVVTEQFAPAVSRGWAELCPDIRRVDVGSRHVDLLKGDALAEVVEAVLAALARATQPRGGEPLDAPSPRAPSARAAVLPVRRARFALRAPATRGASPPTVAPGR